MNQFDRLGDTTLTDNDGRYTVRLDKYLESVLGYPIPCRHVGDSLGWMIGGDDVGDNPDFESELYAVRVVNQDVADLLSYLSNGEALVGSCVMVYVPPRYFGDLIPSELEPIVMTANRWNSESRMCVSERMDRINDIVRKADRALLDVQTAPDVSPFKDEETI